MSCKILGFCEALNVLGELTVVFELLKWSVLFAGFRPPMPKAVELVESCVFFCPDSTTVGSLDLK